MVGHREWLASMIEQYGWKSGAELGVKAGEALDIILSRFDDLEMIGVDDWLERPGYDNGWEHDQYREQAYTIAAKYPDRLRLIESSTVEAADAVMDGSLDFVFIDADHSTRAVIADIEAWRAKLKGGGMLCGDDANKPTVRAALDKAMPDFEIEGRCWYGRPE